MTHFRIRWRKSWAIC